MSTEGDKARMEAQDPQPGMSTFDRNHPATWRRADPMNKRVEQQEMSLRLRQRAPQIEAGDKVTASLMIEAAMLLNQATFAESVWEERARKAEHKMHGIAQEFRKSVEHHRWDWDICECLESHATSDWGRISDNTRSLCFAAIDEIKKLRNELRNYTGDNHTIHAARSGTPSGVQDPSEGAIE